MALGATTVGATRTTAAVVGVAVTAALVIWTCVRAKYDGRAGAGIRTIQIARKIARPALMPTAHDIVNVRRRS